jgi:hypothetical protein
VTLFLSSFQPLILYLELSVRHAKVSHIFKNIRRIIVLNFVIGCVHWESALLPAIRHV